MKVKSKKTLGVLSAVLLTAPVLGVFLVTYAGLGIGGALTPATVAFLVIGAIGLVGAVVSGARSIRLFLLFYLLALSQVFLLVHEDTRLRHEKTAREAEARRVYRDQLLREPIRLACKNGDTAVLHEDESSRNGWSILLVPRRLDAPIMSLAWAGSLPGSEPPIKGPLLRYIANAGDCEGGRYTSLLNLFDILEQRYRDEHSASPGSMARG